MAEVELHTAPVVHSGAEHENGQAVTDNGALKASHEIEYRRLTPYLVLQPPKAAEAIDFYKNVFGAAEIARSLHPKRKADQEHPLILHAHLKLGEAHLMICDDCRDVCVTAKSPSAFQGTTIGATVMLHLDTSDVDAVFSRALEAGAQVTEVVANQPWGQRYGKLTDPFGIVWSIATPIEESCPLVADVDTVEA